MVAQISTRMMKKMCDLVYCRAFYLQTCLVTKKSRRAVPVKYTKPKTMEPKKNPKYDIHRIRGVIFNVSLAISLLLVITAFQLSVKSFEKKEPRHSDKNERSEMTIVPIVYEKKKDVTAPSPIEKVDPKPSPEAVNFKEVSDSKPVNEPPPGAFDQNNPMIELPIGSIEAPPEDPQTVYDFVEKMPEPVGGWEGFFKTLKKNMKYPRKAERAGASGKVFVGFTINEKGELQDFRIIKGIGFGCDEEALRVIALTKWNAGKQRGRPVKVRMVQPVVFSLGEGDRGR